MSAGLVGVAISMALLTLVSLGSNPWLVRLLMFMIGVGMAYIFLPNQAASLATISREATGRASTLFSVQRQLGAALVVALLSSVLAAVGPMALDATGIVRPHPAAYHAAFLTAAGLALIGATIALWVPDRDAAATMRPRPAADAPTPPQEALAANSD